MRPLLKDAEVSTREQYQELYIDGVEPLIDSRCQIEINLRKEIQNELFGKEDNPENRHKLFLWIWERKPRVCEETGAYLGPEMQAVFMSHILTRGAHIECWNDPRNINILTPDAHRHWETGKREKMKIWNKNKDVIAILKSDYAKFKTYKNFPDDKNEILTDKIMDLWFQAQHKTEGEYIDWYKSKYKS